MAQMSVNAAQTNPATQSLAEAQGAESAQQPQQAPAPATTRGNPAADAATDVAAQQAEQLKRSGERQASTGATIQTAGSGITAVGGLVAACSPLAGPFFPLVAAVGGIISFVGVTTSLIGGAIKGGGDEKLGQANAMQQNIASQMGGVSSAAGTTIEQFHELDASKTTDREARGQAGREAKRAARTAAEVPSSSGTNLFTDTPNPASASTASAGMQSAPPPTVVSP